RLCRFARSRFSSGNTAGGRVALQALQVGAQFGCTLVAQIAVFLKQFSDDLAKLCGKGATGSGGGHGIAIENRIENDSRSIAAKRGRLGRHLVEHRSHAEKVAATVEFLSTRLLRRHVGHGADSRSGTGEMHFIHGPGSASAHRLLGPNLGETEVENL